MSQVINNLKTNLKLDGFEYALSAIDTHTVGEFTRIVIRGMPELIGKTMMDKKNYCKENYEHIRTALMSEPRGHKDMFGAILTDPVHEEADFGILFIDNDMYVNMCGHGTIGCATAAVEAGLVPVTEPYTEVVLDAPSGLIRAKVKVENSKAVEVTFTNVPAFLYKENMEMEIKGKKYVYDISFGGSFFAMVDAKQVGLDINKKTVNEFIDIGIELMRKINESQTMHHPTLPIKTVDVVEFYGEPHEDGSDLRNVVVFGNYQADRSPCGTGTSAKLAMMYARNQLKIGETIVNESFIDSKFKGKIIEETTVGEYKAVIPQITGSAYITGLATYLIDPADPHKYGFLID